jgi:hypothetical protein
LLAILKCKCRFADTPRSENSRRETDARSQQGPSSPHFRVGSAVALFASVHPRAETVLSDQFSGLACHQGESHSCRHT